MIYGGNGTFLRIGIPEAIQRELRFNRYLASYGCPTPKVVREGERGCQSFYIEKSVGAFTMLQAFTKDWREKGFVSEQNFSLFLDLTESFAKAQLKTTASDHFDDFYTGIHVDEAITEFPQLRDRIISAAEKVKGRLSAFPVVLTHGDLTPGNILSNGIIDFEFAFNGYAGYDLAGNVYMTYLFPAAGDYENRRKFQFTEQQIDTYLQVVNDIFVKNGLPKVSEYQDDFIFVKMIWSATGLSEEPRFQKWRFRLFEKIMLDYLQGKPIIDTILTFSG